MVRSLYQQRVPILLLFCLYVLPIYSQDCSKTRLCATGCCSKFGFCGTDSAHCGDGCLSTCDYKLGCDASNPCAPGTGCCSKFGFCGLGPDYCAEDICVAGCDSKSYCDPGYSSPGYSTVANCPLNVCCSKFGFCGLTEEFCGNKTVTRPSCGTTGSLTRAIGYYEGWATTRSCDVFRPEDIPIGTYSHINFAFASINPVTFEIAPASTADIDLYTRVTGLKRFQPDLKVYIAIGGWTFNDPGPTATTFSQLAASTANQAKFFASLISFLSTYNFDGVDIDWEYPQAPDRSGADTDFVAFPIFLSNLKRALSSTGGRDGLSVTIPASYWYLQHFDIAEMAKTIDWFNIMTYDLHGEWDIGNQWLGAWLNAHTNLTEITDSLDLLWRNGIPPGMVNLGLAFYARTSTLLSSVCSAPGCAYASAGEAGACSANIGVLMNSEIADVISSKGLTPKLYKDAAVKVITWDDQWVAYDDAETFKLKADFARSQCLGGVFVWAISQDSVNGASARGIAAATNRGFVPTAQAATDLNDNPTVGVDNNKLQCRWSGCGKPCPSGWVTVPRDDEWKNYVGEPIQEDTFCAAGTRLFCCPGTDTIPSCGWYSHHNGICDGTCPAGYKEVGSTHSDCRNEYGYQAACCKISSSTAVSLYDSCGWGGKSYGCQVPCDAGFSELYGSTKGSGGVNCALHTQSSYECVFNCRMIYEKRPYCCNQPEPKKSWNNCNLYTSIGNYPSNADPNLFCESDCPTGLTKIALDPYIFKNKNCLDNGGAAAYCCNATYITTTQVENPEIQRFRDALTNLLAAGTCSVETTAISKRGHSAGEHSTALQVRATKISDETLINALMLQALFNQASRLPFYQLIISAWNAIITVKYPHLVISELKAFFNGWLPLIGRSYEYAMHYLTCNLEGVNARIAKSGYVSCSNTVEKMCDYYDCNSADDEDRPSLDGSADATLKRRLNGNITSEEEFQDLYKRGGAAKRKFDTIDDNSNPVTIRWLQPSYYGSGEWAAGSSVYDNTYSYEDEDDCGNTRLRVVKYSTNGDFATEHIVEGQTIQMFLQDRNVFNPANVPYGSLPSGHRSDYTSLDADFLLKYWNSAIVHGATALPGGRNSAIPSERVMEALGSKKNTGSFVILLQQINAMKALLWAYKDPVKPTSWETLYTDTTNPHRALNIMRTVMTVFEYMNEDTVLEAMTQICNNIRAQFVIIEQAYSDDTGGDTVQLAEPWDEWIRNHLFVVATRAQDWVTDAVTNLTHVWGVRTGSEAIQVMATLTQLDEDKDDIQINVTGLDGE